MNGQKMIRFMGLIAVLAALISAASASGYSQVENDLEFRVDYPIEVEVGSCITINFWMKASQNLTDLVVNLAVYYHQNSEVETLYSEVIVSVDQADIGWTKSKSIRICVPREEPVDPHLRAKLEFRYKVDGVDRELDHEWYMSVVRDETYGELESEVASLRDRVSELKDEVEELEDELEAKTEELESLQEEYQSLLAEHSALETSYQQLKEDYDDLEKEYQELKEDYSSLQDSYSSLSESHQSTLIELERLKTSYETLSRQYESLEEQYRSLLRDYESTLSELRAYKAIYSDLKSRHEDLRARHDDLIAEAASLRQRIADLEEEYSSLNRVYQATLGESSLTKNVLLAQTAAVATGLGIYAFLSRRIGRRERSGSVAEEGNSERKVQKILSGRRITIPSDIASKLGLKKGDEIEIDYADGMIIVKPIKEEPSEGKKEAESKQERGGGDSSES